MRKKQIIMAVILAVGVILRLLKLGSQSVGESEFFTASLSTGQNLLFVFFNSVENGAHPPLFYMLEHLVLGILGTSEFSIRLLPAITGILNIFIFYKLTRSFFSEKVSAIAVFLFALNPFMIYYSQEAGPYSFYLMVSMLIIYYFLMSIKYNSFLAGPFIVWSIIGLYSHENTIVLLLILNFIIFVTNRKDIRLMPWIIAQAVILAAWLPLALLSVRPYSQSMAQGPMLAPFYSLKNFFFGTALPFNWAVISGAVICVIFSVLGVASKRKATEKRVLDALSIVIVLVMAVQWVISLVRPGSYADKNILIAAALIIIVLSVGVSYMSDQGLAAFIVLISAVYGVSLFNYFFSPGYAKTAYRGLFKKISAQAVEGSMIIHTSRYSWSAFEFYGKLAYKTGYINRLSGEPAAFSGRGVQLSMRNMRNNIRENLNRIFKFNIESGYDSGLISREELKGMAASYRRAFIVMDNEAGRKQPLFLQSGIRNGITGTTAGAQPEEVWWVGEYFRVKEKISVPGCDAYALEKK